MAELTDQELYAVWSPIVKRQSNVKTPLAANLLTKRLPLVQPSVPTRTRNRKTVYHCNGIDIIKESISDQLARWTFATPADATILAAMMSLNYGATLAPTGTPQDEIQTIANGSAASGNFKILLTFEGRSGETKDIPYNANAATIKAALEETGVIEYGDVNVTGTLITGIAVTFVGRLAKADIAALTVNAAGLTGGTVTVTETQKGANKLHNIARSVARELPLTSFLLGFEEDETPPVIYKGFACDAIIVEAVSREDLSCTFELIGRADTTEALDFIVPACLNISPIEMKDCRFRVDGEYLTSELERVRFERRNNIPVGKGAFPWDDKNIARVWRGAQPTEQFSFGYYGSRDTNPASLYAKAERENNTKYPVILDLGNPGDRVSIIAPATNLKLADNNPGFDNDLRLATVNVDGTPHFSESINASSRVEARIAETATFLSL